MVKHQKVSKYYENDCGLSNFQNVTFKKITITVMEVVLMASSYHSKLDLLKTRESHFSFVWHMNFSIISSCLDRAKVFTVNSNRTNLVDVQRLHENIQRIICVSNRVCILFTNTFFLWCISLLEYSIYG